MQWSTRNIQEEMIENWEFFEEEITRELSDYGEIRVEDAIIICTMFFGYKTREGTTLFSRYIDWEHIAEIMNKALNWEE